MKASSPRIRGFTLIELLVVVFIIAIIAVFAIPATSTILRGSQMAQASQILADQISLARQYALSKNHPVEVRFIRFADPEVPGEYNPSSPAQPANGNYRAIQIMETMDAVDPNTNDFVRLPLDKPQLLPQAIIMNQDVLSTLIKEAGTSPITPSKTSGVASGNDPQLPKSVNGQPVPYDYVYFRFLPDGSTNLPVAGSTSPAANGSWCVTLVSITPPGNNIITTPPANFFTLQIDPVTGTIKQFRPGI